MNWNYKDGKLLINDESLLIPEFKALYDLGDIGIKHLQYIYLIADISDDNPLRNIQENEKEDKAEKICYSVNPDSPFFIGLATEEAAREMITTAYNVYLKLNETSPTRLLISIDKKIDQIRVTLEELQPKVVENYNEKTGATTFASNLKLITDALQEIDSLMGTRESISKRIQKEDRKVKSKGNKERSPLQEGLLNKVKL